ncbi:hypothetical protein MMC13_005534 [Lambiella insularis]|nr:hypothetical protein [Lambiella insularis]
MESSAGRSQHSALQKQAIDKAKLAYSRLPHGDAIFRQCVKGKKTPAEVLSTVEQKCQSYKKKRSIRFLEKVQKHTAWLQNIGDVVDVAVQSQAGIGCPLWAPIKLVLKISNDHAKATEEVVNLLELIIECLPRLEVYEKLQSERILQVALLHVFADVIEFSVRAFQFFRRGTLVRLSQILIRTFDRDAGVVMARLERHARLADQTVVATELLRVAEFRVEAQRRQHEEMKIQCERWLRPSNVEHVHLQQVRDRLEGACNWITSNYAYQRWTKEGCLTTQVRLLVISGTHGSLEAEARSPEEHLLLQLTQKVLDVCGGLVSIRNGFLRLIHSSIKEFLVRPEGDWICEPDSAVLNFKLDIFQSHRSFAWLCLDYLELNKEKNEILGPKTPQFLQILRDSFPLLDYAISCPFHHLNRSGPLCSATLAKVDKALESIQSGLWVECFTHLLLDDLTLELQVYEVEIFLNLMADAGMRTEISAIFEKCLKEKLTSQIQTTGSIVNPGTDQWEMLPDVAGDEQSEIGIQNHDNKVSGLAPEPTTNSMNLTTGSSYPRASLKDLSATMSRIMELLNGQSPLVVTHQIEVLLRLQALLRKSRALTDPLKVLFRLILKMAPRILVYTLMAIGNFYWKLRKFQEALEVFIAASKKLDLLNVPLKFRIYQDMGYCYYELHKYTEALQCYERALLGQESLLGKGHYSTLYSVLWMGDCYHALGMDMEALKCCEKAYTEQEIVLGARHSKTLESLFSLIGSHADVRQHSEVIRLCNKMCMGQDVIPELDIASSLKVQRYKFNAYHNTGEHEKAAHTKERVQTIIQQCHESRNKDNRQASLNNSIGLAYCTIGDYNKALHYYQLAYEEHNRKYGPTDKRTLVNRSNICDTYYLLGRGHEVGELWETVYKEQARILGPNHPDTKLTKDAMDSWNTIYDDGNDSDCFSFSTSQLSRTISRRNSFDLYNDFDYDFDYDSSYIDMPQRPYSATF